MVKIVYLKDRFGENGACYMQCEGAVRRHAVAKRTVAALSKVRYDRANRRLFILLCI